MGFVIGQSTTGVASTWGQLRCPVIGAYDQYETWTHSLIVDSGFHPEEGLFVRVAGWPFESVWFDVDSQRQVQNIGPIVGFSDGTSVDPAQDSFFSIGTYNSSANGANGPTGYSSFDNLLDQGDIDDGFIGLTVTYTSGTFTIDSDALENEPPSFPWYGQNIGVSTITEVTEIETFTAF
jgi:hypothetical protein